jgi:hypothetical protein
MRAQARTKARVTNLGATTTRQPLSDPRDEIRAIERGERETSPLPAGVQA